MGEDEGFILQVVFLEEVEEEEGFVFLGAGDGVFM